MVRPRFELTFGATEFEDGLTEGDAYRRSLPAFVIVGYPATVADSSRIRWWVASEMEVWHERGEEFRTVRIQHHQEVSTQGRYLITNPPKSIHERGVTRFARRSPRLYFAI
jgi:hypothetical protein